MGKNTMKMRSHWILGARHQHWFRDLVVPVEMYAGTCIFFLSLFKKPVRVMAIFLVL